MNKNGMNKNGMNKNGSSAASLCEAYLPARKRMLKNKKEIAMYRKKLEKEATTFERLLLEDCIAYKEHEMKDDFRITAIFEAAMPLLADKERNVIRQLYQEGRKWSEVVNCEGKIMNPKTISSVRAKAIAEIDPMISMLYKRGFVSPEG